MHLLSGDDKAKISRFFNACLQIYGKNSPHALSWSDRKSQILRFEVLSQEFDLEGSSILDVGCGLGDFWEYLNERYQHITYTGIDITEALVEQACEKYPEGRFLTRDVFDIPNDSYDYVFASGIFAYNLPDCERKYLEIIRKMYDTCRRGIGFNMLNYDYHEIDEFFMAFDPEDMRRKVNALGGKTKLVQDYLPQDFTIFISKIIEDI